MWVVYICFGYWSGHGLFGTSACTGAALSATYIIVYCVVAALSAYVCYYALNSGGLVGSRMLLWLNGYDSL